MSVVNALNSLKLPWILLCWLIVTWVLIVIYKLISANMGDKPTTPWLSMLVAALNALTTPWFALIVLVMGMVFDIYSHLYGLAPDSANQIIGAGLGLLTGQGAAAAAHALQQIQESQRNGNPTPPAAPPPNPPANQ